MATRNKRGYYRGKKHFKGIDQAGWLISWLNETPHGKAQHRIGALVVAFQRKPELFQRFNRLTPAERAEYAGLDSTIVNGCARYRMLSVPQLVWFGPKGRDRETKVWIKGGKWIIKRYVEGEGPLGKPSDEARAYNDLLWLLESRFAGKLRRCEWRKCRRWYFKAKTQWRTCGNPRCREALWRETPKGKKKRAEIQARHYQKIRELDQNAIKRARVIRREPPKGRRRTI